MQDGSSYATLNAYTEYTVFATKFTTKGHTLWSISIYKMLRLAQSAQIPWLEKPVVFDIRAKPRNIASLTGTKGQLGHRIPCSLAIH